MSEQELKLLLAERQIQQALVRYCRGVDRMDDVVMRSAFHSDATIHLSGFNGTIDEFAQWLWQFLPMRTMTMHYIANSLIEFDPNDPNLAFVETYSFSMQRSDTGKPQGNLISGARYLDRFSHRDGKWLIEQRHTSVEWMRQDDLAGQWPIGEGVRRGKRDGTDPVIAGWEQLRSSNRTD